MAADSVPGTSLTHFDESGACQMVDVGQKAMTSRTARAEAHVQMLPATAALIRGRGLAKGDVLEVARLAGIMAAKRTADLIPLCHPLGLDRVSVQFDWPSESDLRIETVVSLEGKTGVEMEALTAASVAALTVYDMCKAVERGMTITTIRLLEKSGGKSGHFQREE